MTPIETLVKMAERLKDESKGNLEPNDYQHMLLGINSCIRFAQSILPIEQQFNCEFELFARGYEWDGTHYYDSFQLNPAKYTPTELLQLFTNKNEGK